jgi:ATP-binding cassette subfamily B (MDR/TAP) protein 1
MISGASSFILGIILAFIASPRIAGIALGLSPLLIVAGAVEA